MIIKLKLKARYLGGINYRKNVGEAIVQVFWNPVKKGYQYYFKFLNDEKYFEDKKDLEEYVKSRYELLEPVGGL